ncbi:MAG: CDP-alcohol phosphatidyltransferase family protein [Candidatus Limivicinus sp.]|nr:CDP-alcohol phosphatidyltransferase family protein [Candidatus Limivicinus sp.]
MKQITRKQIFTIPNFLSFLRLCMIPLIIWLYCSQNNYALTAVVLVLSGVTDTIDGFIARRFNMVTDLGKALDPIADKLTQASVMFCLLTRFQMMLVPLLLLIFKEVCNGIMSLFVIKKTGKVCGADWHGKVCTWLLYAMMFLHIVWFDISRQWSTALISICVIMMTVSFALYMVRNYKMLTNEVTNNDNAA